MVLSVVRPRPTQATSVPALIQLFQNEWDALMVETYTLKQHLAHTRKARSHDAMSDGDLPSLPAVPDVDMTPTRHDVPHMRAHPQTAGRLSLHPSCCHVSPCGAPLTD